MEINTAINPRSEDYINLLSVEELVTLAEELQKEIMHAMNVFEMTLTAIKKHVEKD